MAGRCHAPTQRPAMVPLGVVGEVAPGEGPRSLVTMMGAAVATAKSERWVHSHKTALGSAPLPQPAHTRKRPARQAAQALADRSCGGGWPAQLQRFICSHRPLTRRCGAGSPHRSRSGWWCSRTHTGPCSRHQLHGRAVECASASDSQIETNLSSGFVVFYRRASSLT